MTLSSENLIVMLVGPGSPSRHLHKYLPGFSTPFASRKWSI